MSVGDQDVPEPPSQPDAVDVVADLDAQQWNPAWIRSNARELAASPDWFDRLLVAEVVGVDGDILASLAQDEHERVRTTARSNLSTPAAFHGREAGNRARSLLTLESRRTRELRLLLDAMAASPYAEERLLVANHWATPLVMLERLSHDRIPAIRAAVAACGLEPATLRRLAQDQPLVAAVAARNPKLPRSMLRVLALHSSVEVRLSVAASRRTPDFLLAMLAAGDSSQEVRGVARNTLGDAPAASVYGFVLPEFDPEALPQEERKFLDHRPRLDAMAMHAVLVVERKRGWTPIPQDHSNPGFDILSRGPHGERICLEVKGVGPGASKVKVSRSQLDLAEREPDIFVLAIVRADQSQATAVTYVRSLVKGPLPSACVSVEFDVVELERGGESVYRQVGPMFADRL